MFRIVKSPRAWWPVTWSGVTEDGEPVENRIEMRFRLMKVDEFVQMMRDFAEVEQAAATDADPKKTSVAFAAAVERIAVDWRGVLAENGEPLPWSSDNLALLMNEPTVFDQTLAAFKAVVRGGAEIRSGN